MTKREIDLMRGIVKSAVLEVYADILKMDREIKERAKSLGEKPKRIDQLMRDLKYETGH